jgi:hypothetical protein
MKALILCSLISSSLLIGCSSDQKNSFSEQGKTIRAENEARIKICIQKGHAYYNELGYGKGNYLLTTGRMRDDEVLIRCERTSGHAF